MLSCSLSYDTQSLTLTLTKKIQKPINRTTTFWKICDGIDAFRSHIELQTNTPSQNKLSHNPSEKVVEYVWQNIIPSISDDPVVSSSNSLAKILEFTKNIKINIIFFILITTFTNY